MDETLNGIQIPTMKPTTLINLNDIIEVNMSLLKLICQRFM